jgi:DNA-binding response OmpR family regulator
MARILVIEDDPHAREMLNFRLQKAGYEIVEATDGDMGLVKAMRQPHLIIMDIRLPKIDGWELCRLLRAEPRTKHIPIIMLTGCSQPTQEEYGKICGADAYLTKPWDSKQLLALTQQFLNKPSHDSQAA